MSDLPEAGTSRSGPLWQDDYLAPPAIPTGEKPADVLNVIWRKNEVFLDIGSWALGSAVLVIWPSLMLSIYITYISGSEATKWLIPLYACMFGPAILLILYSLTKPAPPPLYVSIDNGARFVCLRRTVAIGSFPGSR